MRTPSVLATYALGAHCVRTRNRRDRFRRTQAALDLHVEHSRIW
jgi:hypothetical protein